MVATSSRASPNRQPGDAARCDEVRRRYCQALAGFAAELVGAPSRQAAKRSRSPVTV
jgi:hypothetical protein